MSKEKYYDKIKRLVYRKFNELEVIDSSHGNDLYIRYKNDDYAQVLIAKTNGYVFYYYEFKDKICNMIQLEERDFKILLERWVQDTFQIKVELTVKIDYMSGLLVEDTNKIT